MPSPNSPAGRMEQRGRREQGRGPSPREWGAMESAGGNEQDGGAPLRRWPPEARWAAGCGSCCALLVLAQVLGAWAILNLVFQMRPPEGVTLQLNIPAAVTAAREFPVELSVRNAGPRPFQIDSIIHRPPPTGRVSLVGPQPPPRATTAMLGSQVWSYGRTLQPGESWSVRFTGAAAEEGSHAGSLEVQVGLVPRRVPYRLRVTSPASRR